MLIAVHLALVVRHKHTQYPGPGKREDNVVGQRLWPTYTAKAGGLFFLVASVLAALGGLAQINAIWVTGPYRQADVSSASQPDWYMGWTEGGLRLMPPFEIRAFGFQIPNPFFPGVLLPTVVFGILYVWPFIEQRVSKTTGEHHLLFRPRDHPVHTGHRRRRVRVHRRDAAGRLQRRDRGDLRALGQRGDLDPAHRPLGRAADRRARRRTAVRRAPGS